jgi:hypothetical protein
LGGGGAGGTVPFVVVVVVVVQSRQYLARLVPRPEEYQSSRPSGRRCRVVGMLLLLLLLLCFSGSSYPKELEQLMVNDNNDNAVRVSMRKQVEKKATTETPYVDK